MQFSLVTVEEIERLDEIHPLVRAALPAPTILSLTAGTRSCPDTVTGFPWLFYLIDGQRIVSSFSAMPDRVWLEGDTHHVAWAGSLVTDPAYRGKGLATKLITDATDALHRRNIAWAGVFSTPAALRIYRKLGFTLAGYAPRYVMLKTLRPLLEGRLKSRLLLDLTDGLYRQARRALPFITRRPRDPVELGLVVETVVPATATESARTLPDPVYHGRYHFNDSLAKLEWKLQHGRGGTLHLISSKEGTPLGYFVLRCRSSKQTVHAQRGDFTLMTMMDFGVYVEEPQAYSWICDAVASRFAASEADVLEIVSSSPLLKASAARMGMLRAGGGMSFTFSAPPTWNLKSCASETSQWHLTHFCGDAYSFG